MVYLETWPRFFGIPRHPLCVSDRPQAVLAHSGAHARKRPFSPNSTRSQRVSLRSTANDAIDKCQRGDSFPSRHRRIRRCTRAERDNNPEVASTDV
jgi:hypothetical protein